MKISSFLLIISFVSVTASSYSQSKISVDLKNVTVKEVFTDIEKKSDFKFLYRNELVNVDRLVSINATNESVEEVLARLFNQSDLTFKVFEDNLVVITNKNAQQKKLAGSVTDAQTGDPLPGVNIILEGTTLGTTTDMNGKFSMDISQESGQLVFSYIGYVAEKVAYTGQAVLEVKLVPDVKSLEEVVVVGYGTQKKSDVTGSVTSVSKQRLQQIPVTNIMQALEGSVAGVNVTQESSVPGAETTTTIRGINSINASTKPFVVVDGMPFYGNTNDINSNDIESIEILKDASAVAIYGTRGSNGVILVTTKRGNTGKPVIKYSGYAGVENMSHILKPRTASEYVQKYADYMSQTGQTLTDPVPNAYEMINYDLGKTTDWISEATQQGLIQDHNISISGGAKDVKYFVSSEYLDQKGVVKGYQYKRINVRSNLDVNVTDYLTTGTSLFFSNNNYDGGRTNLLNASAMSPYASAVDEATGKYMLYPMYPELLYKNPLLGLYTDRLDRSVNMSGNVYAELSPKFIKGFKYRLNGSYSYNPKKYRYYEGTDAGNTSGGYADTKDEDTKIWVVENIVTYSHDIGKHHFDLTGLYSAQENKYDWMRAQGTGFINDELSYNDLSAATTQQTDSYTQKYTMVSQMGRLNYSYDSRYLLTVTARRDGYSAFGSNMSDKYAVFPSMALGWNLSKESFLNNIKAINVLKLRFSYGLSGNMAVDPYKTVTTEKAVQQPFNGSAKVGLIGDVMGNKDLHWENTLGSNLGLDFAVLDNRVTGTIDFYKNKSTDLLLQRNIPLITGYSSTWDNLGELQNTGVEISLHTVNLTLGDFRWESNINFAKNKNKLVDLYGDKQDDVGNKWFIGQPISVIYDYEMVGVWQEGEDPTGWDASAKAGYLKFKDQLTVDSDGDGVYDQGDGKIDSKDKVILGSRYPKWTGGITNTFHYKNLHLSVFIQTYQGALKNNPDLNYSDEQGRRNTPQEVGYWTATNKSNSRPSLAYTNTLGYGFPCHKNYTRIKDITLSYNLPKTILSKIGVESMNLYLSGRNLYTFTDWIGWDPEDDYDTRGSGDWTNNYPNTRSVVFGINVSLK